MGGGVQNVMLKVHANLVFRKRCLSKVTMPLRDNQHLPYLYMSFFLLRPCLSLSLEMQIVTRYNTMIKLYTTILGM